MKVSLIRALVKHVLMNALDYKWSLQGFGMLRLHLDDEHRLNVWDSRFRVPNVSMMHTHPWDFKSLVVSGTLVNQRYAIEKTKMWPDGEVYHSALIKPGTGGGMLGTVAGVVADPTKIENLWLLAKKTENFRTGDVYSQKADEIHVSHPSDGAVTLNKRTRVGEDLARVFWPFGKVWVSAEPREATPEQVQDVVLGALSRWEKLDL